MIDGLERHRAQLAPIDSDNAVVVDSWLATRFLASLLPMALEVFLRSRRNLAHCPAPDRPGLLRAHCDRSAQPDRTGICGDHRARPSLFIPRASYRLGAVQSAICSAALYSRNFDGRPTSDRSVGVSWKRLAGNVPPGDIAVSLARDSGMVLSFAHTLGEFGVVLMIGGDLAGVTRTISISIFDQVQALDYGAANLTSLALLLFSFLVLAITYGLQRRVFAVWSPR